MFKMKKNFGKIVGTLALATTLGLGAYVAITTTVNAAVADGTEQPVGGCKANQGSLSLKKNKAAKSAFDKAVKDLDGYTYQPVAYLGSQVVSRNNYSYLCKGKAVVPKAKTEYFILNVYEDLSGKAEITGTHDLLTRGWKYNQGKTKNASVNATLKKAMKMLVGANYTPIAYVGKSGKNYAVFCSKKVTAPKAKRSYSMVIVKKQSKKKVKLVKIQDVSLDVPDKKN